MKKIILAIVISLGFSGCVITAPTVLGGAVIAVGVAEDVGGIARLYKDTKDYLLDDSNSTKD